jgi:thymidine phosphorylase
VGFSQFVPLGQAVQTGEVLAVVHAADQQAAERARRSLLTLLQIAPQAPASAPVLIRRLVA